MHRLCIFNFDVTVPILNHRFLIWVQAVWLGHALHDNEATIIHHFAFYEDPQKFKFPNLGSGIAISTNLLQISAQLGLRSLINNPI